MYFVYRWGESSRTDIFPRPNPFLISADEGIDVGVDNETNVSDDYKEGENKFTGKIRKVVIDIKP
jgi:arylsulfatase